MEQQEQHQKKRSELEQCRGVAEEGKAKPMKKLLCRFPFTLFCIALIWYLCLFKPPSTRLDRIPGLDKYVHVLMYLGTCSVFWFEYFRSRVAFSRRTLLLVGVVLPILMSGAIELVQANCTTYRGGDWADFLANSCGVLLALALVPLFRKHFNKPS